MLPDSPCDKVDELGAYDSVVVVLFGVRTGTLGLLFGGKEFRRFMGGGIYDGLILDIPTGVAIPIPVRG